EDIEREQAAGHEQLAGGAQGGQALHVVVGQVQVRAEGAHDQRDALGDGRATEVSRAQVDPVGDAGRLGPAAADVEHAFRAVDADHGDAGGGDGHRDPSRADAELDHGCLRGDTGAACGLARFLHVEGDVFDDAPAPRVVQRRDPVVLAGAGTRNLWHSRSLTPSPRSTRRSWPKAAKPPRAITRYSRPMDASALQSEALAAISGASTVADLEEARVRYLGRKSELALALRAVRDRETGMTLNGVRDALEAAVAERRAALERAELERTLAEDSVDVTLPGDELPLGHLHPTTHIRRIVEDAFLGLGYQVYDDREVEWVEDNFDKLAFPEWHPTRSPRDTFFLDERRVLRTETSPSQIHVMQEQEPPIYMVSIGRVYRRDEITPTRFPIFHQFEGLAVDRHITIADLKGTLLHVMRALFGAERAVR